MQEDTSRRRKFLTALHLQTEMRNGIILTEGCFIKEVGLTKHIQALPPLPVWTLQMRNTEMRCIMLKTKAEPNIIPTVLTAVIREEIAALAIFVRVLFAPIAVANVWAAT